VYRRANLRGYLVFLILAVLTASFLYPLYFMLINSLKTRTEYFVNPFSLPHEGLQLINYTTMISQFKILTLFKNTFIISTGTVILILMVGIFASYAFAKLRFKGKSVLFVAVLMTMFVPSQVTIIPLFVSFSKVGLVNTYLSVILAYLAVSYTHLTLPTSDLV